MHNIDFVIYRTYKDGSTMQEDEFKVKKIELYKQTVEFIDRLKQSKHPNTVCWLLEILHVLTSKFTMPTTMNRESSLMKKMDVTLQFLLTSAAKIIESDPQTIRETSNCYL